MTHWGLLGLVGGNYRRKVYLVIPFGRPLPKGHETISSSGKVEKKHGDCVFKFSCDLEDPKVFRDT